MTINLTLSAHLVRFNAREARPLAATPRANLWTVTVDGQPAVLKIFTPAGKNAGEGKSADVLRLWDGKGAVRLHQSTEDAILMDHVAGNTLATFACHDKRADEQAAYHLARCAKALRHAAHDDYPNLKTYGAALPQTDLSRLPMRHRATFRSAQDVFSGLIKTTQDVALLHGDLHHENIMGTGDNWLAIDPKGVNGDPAYEFANAFKNPTEIGPALYDPARFLRLSEIFTAVSGLDRDRIEAFGFCQSALSIAWSLNYEEVTQQRYDLMEVFGKIVLPKVT